MPTPLAYMSSNGRVGSIGIFLQPLCELGDLLPKPANLFGLLYNLRVLLLDIWLILPKKFR